MRQNKTARAVSFLPHRVMFEFIESGEQLSKIAQTMSLDRNKEMTGASSNVLPPFALLIDFTARTAYRHRHRLLWPGRRQANSTRTHHVTEFHKHDKKKNTKTQRNNNDCSSRICSRYVVNKDFPVQVIRWKIQGPFLSGQIPVSEFAWVPIYGHWFNKNNITKQKCL